MLYRHVASLLGCAAIVASLPAAAQASERRAYDMPAQPLGQAIRELSHQSGRNILVPAELVASRTAPALKGFYTVDEALDVLLGGTDLRRRTAGSALILEAGDPAAQVAVEPDILVTGTRIRGAQVASPVIKLDRETIRSRGQATLPDALRSLPQNFGGGQNPGVGQNVPEIRGADLGGGSSINLRGLGSDATLTLLDGHRLSYNAFKQSVDISGIPLGAIGRLDVVPDGASALFGSDAVAGVVNIVLRRDLNGLETGARISGTSDGGDFSQIYSVTGGKTWTGGGVLVAYEFGQNSPVISNQRDYAAIRPNLTILPGMRRHSGLITFRQDLAPWLAFALDAIGNKRWSAIDFPLNNAGDLNVSRAHFFTTAQSWGLAPSLTLRLPGNWEASLTGSFGQDRVDYGTILHFGTSPLDLGSGYYRNRERSVEASGNGALFALPGGTAKLAVGAGYRRIDFLRFNGVGNAQNIDRSQIDTYAFGELSLPVAKAITLNAAARYEDYRGVGTVVTPKFGIIIAPSPDVSLKGSWGKSFRAPTLYQQYQPRNVSLYDITRLGGSGYPAGTTVLYLTGGNQSASPERSTNWSATLDLHPRPIAGLGFELSYFHVEYRDRIVIPIPSSSVSLSNPLYASRVTLNPAASAQAATIASAATFLNQTSAAYDPARVGAIVDNSNVNAGHQTLSGIDALARYSAKAGSGTLSASFDLAYLTSKQQLGPGLPVTPLAGTIFNPPHLRVRADLGWTAGPVSLVGAVTWIGPVTDNRTISPVRVDDMAPIDLTFRFAPVSGPLRGFDLIVSVQNLLNVKPERIATSLYSDAAYDSTNYSPVGRQLSLGVTKKW